MARISNGDALTSAMLQPGWTSTSDGFGLIMITATFKSDHDGSFEPFVRGTSFPVSSYSYCKSHKGSVSWDSLGIATMKVDYVGIDPSVNSGAMTKANTSSANGLTAENITSHHNFFTATGGFGTPIAGPSPYDQDVDGEYAPLVAKDTYGYIGLNGACFEKELGGRFIGFVDPGYPKFYGKTQYLAKTTTYSGVIYMSNISQVQALYALLGSATSSNSWGGFQLIPAWGPVGSGDSGNMNLLSQVNVEEYGSLYKVNYEIRYSKQGWPSEVYANV